MSIDWQSVRAEFPALAHTTWLNSATFGQVPMRAQLAISRHFERRNRLGGRDFLHWFGAADAIRQDVALLFDAKSEDVAFIPHTACALSLFVNGINWRAGDEVVTFEDEFPNQIYAAAMLEDRGVRLVRARPREWQAALSERTRLVAISQTNYSTGVEAPVSEMAATLRQRGTLFYLDGTQTAGVRRFDFGACEPDLYAVNGYKWMNSPPGSAFMLVPARTRAWLAPSTVGWRSHHDWRNVCNLHDGRPTFAEAAERYEGGMLPFMNLFAMQEAVRLVREIGVGEAEARALRLAGLVRDELRAIGAELLGDENPMANGHIVAARLPSADPGSVAREMEKDDVIVSARSGFLRVSPHYYNDEADIERFATALRKALNHG
ncbi:MAG: aminotransferase class V-fold PLP-dependent enzyme [Bryobacterales bacterium]|nr:aminotransferase class V-fold PLP-dependent enzyme [Bryobacterales bacterium]